MKTHLVKVFAVLLFLALDAPCLYARLTVPPVPGEVTATVDTACDGYANTLACAH